MEKSDKRLGILVVHGIGGPPPGETLTNLADALEVEGYITYRGDLIDERRRSAPDPYQADTPLQERLVRGGPLPVQLAYGYSKNKSCSELQPVVMAEAFWADVTKLPGGIVGVLRGYFDIFFNMIILIRSSAPRLSEHLRKTTPGDETELFRKMEAIEDAQRTFSTRPLLGVFSPLSILTTKIISGPIAAANIYLMILVLSVLFTAPFMLNSNDLVYGPQGQSQVTQQLLVTASVIAILLVFALAWVVRARICRNEKKAYRLGAPSELLELFCLSAFTVAGLAAAELLVLISLDDVLVTKTIDAAAFHVAYYLVIVFGGLVTPLLIILLSLAYIVWALCFRRPDLEIIFLAPLLQSALWMILLPEFWRILVVLFPQSLSTDVYSLIPSLMAGVPAGGTNNTYFEWEGLQAFSLIAFAVCASGFFVSRAISLGNDCIGNDCKKQTGVHRAIISKPLAVIGSALMIFACLHVFGATMHYIRDAVHTVNSAAPLSGMTPWLAALLHALGASIETVTGWVTSLPIFAADVMKAVTAWLLGFEILKASPVLFAILMSFGMESLRQALSLADEIVSYLRYNGVTARKRELMLYHEINQINAQDKQGSTLEEIDRRRPIRRCFNQALNCLLKDYDITHLLVISHSQGTVIALDELNEDSQSCPGRFRNRNRDVQLSWVTMGSPIAHLYQHYFPSCYPRFFDRSKVRNDDSVTIVPYWKNLSIRVDRWVNLFRNDDFVGTTMEMGDRIILQHSSGDERECIVFNEYCIGSGGHGNYWSDTEMLQRLGDVLRELGYDKRKKNPVETWRSLTPQSADRLAGHETT